MFWVFYSVAYSSAFLGSPLLVCQLSAHRFLWNKFLLTSTSIICDCIKLHKFTKFYYSNLKDQIFSEVHRLSLHEGDKCWSSATLLPHTPPFLGSCGDGDSRRVQAAHSPTNVQLLSCPDRNLEEHSRRVRSRSCITGTAVGLFRKLPRTW